MVDTTRVVNLAGSSEPVSMYNGDVAAIASVVFQRNLADCIVDIQRGEVLPMLAKAWAAPDDDTWVLTLRDDVSFHAYGGNAANKFTAQAYKDHVDYMQDEANNIARGRSRFANWESMEVTGEYELTVTTGSPNPTEILQHTVLNCGLHDQAVSDEVGIAKFRELGVGTGPYMDAEWIRQEKVILTKNPDYFWEPALADQATAPDTAIIFNIPEAATRVAALLTGEMDWIVNPPLDQTPTITKSAAARVVAPPQFDVQVHWPNLKGPPVTHSLMTDVRFREALAVALDRKTLVDEIMLGFAAVTPDGWPSTSQFYDPSLPIWPPYDPTRARELIAELTAEGLYDPDEAVELSAPFGGVYPQDEQVTQASAAMLEEVGIKAEVALLENVVREQVVSGKLWKGLMMRLPVDGFGDPAGFQWGYFKPGSFGVPALGAFVDDPIFVEYRRLATDALGTPVGPERVRKWQLAHNQYKTMFVRWPIYQLSFVYGVSNNWDWEPDQRETTFIARFQYLGK